jgi:hypothetical protein
MDISERIELIELGRGQRFVWTISQRVSHAKVIPSQGTDAYLENDRYRYSVYPRMCVECCVSAKSTSFSNLYFENSPPRTEMRRSAA